MADEDFFFFAFYKPILFDAQSLLVNINVLKIGKYQY